MLLQQRKNYVHDCSFESYQWYIIFTVFDSLDQIENKDIWCI